MNNFIKTAIYCIFALLFVNSSYAIEDRGVWQKSSNSCAIAQRPLKEEGDCTSRGKTFFVVQKMSDVIQVYIEAGYPYKDQYIKVSIDGVDHTFFPDNKTAWSLDDDRKIIEAMKAGIDMIIEGTSSRGTLTTDTYTLKGFTRAFNNLENSC